MTQDEPNKKKKMDSMKSNIDELTGELTALADIYRMIELQDSNTQYLNNVINNLVSQLNKYKRNQSWKLKILLLFNVILFIIRSYNPPAA